MSDYSKLAPDSALMTLLNYKILHALAVRSDLDWARLTTLPELIEAHQEVEKYIHCYHSFGHVNEMLTEEDDVLFASLADEVEMMQEAKREYSKAPEEVKNLLSNEDALRQIALQISCFEGCIYNFLIDAPRDWNNVVDMLRTQSGLFKDEDDVKSFLIVGEYLRYFDADSKKCSIIRRRYRRTGLLLGMLSLSTNSLPCDTEKVLTTWILDRRNDVYIDGDLVDLIRFALGNVPLSSTEAIISSYSPEKTPLYLRNYLFAFVAGGYCKDQVFSERVLNVALSGGISNFAISFMILRNTDQAVHDYINTRRSECPALWFYANAAFRLHEVADSEELNFEDIAEQDTESPDFETHLRGILEYGILEYIDFENPLSVY